MKLQHITEFFPAYDKRSSNPSKNFGIGAMTCRMVVQGEEGATHFVFSTGILLESTMEDYIDKGLAKYEKMSYGCHYLNKPLGFDVGYHSRTPQFDGQEVRWPTKMRKTGPKPFDIKFDKIGKEPPACDLLGVPCYTDGSALRAEEYMKILTEEGSEPIWKKLEEYYKQIFKK